ncbi:hypothetical protein INT44_005461 [Umbelopsis vinacea]|uniref:sn-1-specific diacylglycerol lipase n=1 Tax=Umbelopsis vinacea TaxID=44442 RepID=A0A8H7QAF6_9FUNG|nr:hypothetical protein INT44_005461 [Umbelopsis vinacea]
MALQLATYHTSSFINSPTLLPENVASLITAVSIAARLSLRCSSLFIEALLESARYSTAFSLGMSRQTLIAALSTAKRLHMIRFSTNPEEEIREARGGFLQVLDKYTNLGVYIVHHSFTLAELFAMTGFHLTTQTIKTGFRTAEESVRILDGIFGSNETSRAIASLVSLVHRELLLDPDFTLSKNGKIAILAGLTRALTSFAVLQNVTHHRMMAVMPMTVVWEGLVIEEEEDESTSVQVADNNRSLGSTNSENVDNPIMQHPDIIHELESILAHEESSVELKVTPPEGTKDKDLIVDSAYSSPSTSSTYDADVYEITTTTKTFTTKTTSFRPLNPSRQGHEDNNEPAPAKYVIVKSEDETQESFVAIVDRQNSEDDSNRIDAAKASKFVSSDDPGSTSSELRTSRGFRVMLSAMSKKFNKKKIERQERYAAASLHKQIADESSVNGKPSDSLPSQRVGPTTTMTSTSTTTRSTSAQYHERSLKAPAVPPKDHQDSSDDELYDDDRKKEKKNWSRFKLKGVAKNKSMNNIFQQKPNGSNGSGELVPSNKKVRSRTTTPPVPSKQTKTPVSGGGHKRISSAHSITPIPTLSTSSRRRPRSNSITSMTSIQSVARTTTTTTFTTSPGQSSPSSPMLKRMPSAPVQGQLSKRRQNSQPLSDVSIRHNFPRAHLVTNIARFMRYASAAYGESFMRILGIGDMPHILPASHHHHPNHHAFSYHTTVPVEDILLSSYTDSSLLSIQNPQINALVHYVTVDHAAEAVVLTCRGTLGLSDILTDLTCEYSEFTLPQTGPDGKERRFTAHGGMLGAAQLLAKQKGKVYRVIYDALEQWPTYGLILCGHSLGAGVASLLSVLWSQETDDFAKMEGELYCRALPGFPAKDTIPFVTNLESGLPPGRPIHCYTFGPPCVMSIELSEYCGHGLVTSVIHSYDIVSSLSLGLLKDFKNVAISLYDESRITDEIISRIIGRYQKNGTEGSTSDGPESAAAKQPEETHQPDDDEQWFWALIKTMRADMNSEKLYPPSTIYHIESIPQLVQHTDGRSETLYTKKRTAQSKRAHTVVLRKCENVQKRFSEIIFSRSMFLDHSPNNYEKSIRQLCRGYFGEFEAYENV